MTYTPEQIARVCHSANQALQVIGGDPLPSVPWDCETQETRDSAVSGVRHAMEGMSPEELHAEWMAFKREAGWTWGPLKDPVAKTHPCLVPYAELPDGQRVKDAVFTAIVRAVMLECPVAA